MSTDPLKLWNDTQPTLLINSVKLIKNHQSARKKAKTVSQKHHECDSLSSQNRLSVAPDSQGFCSRATRAWSCSRTSAERWLRISTSHREPQRKSSNLISPFTATATWKSQALTHLLQLKT